MPLEKQEGGYVLAVPKSAVLDIGAIKLVYIEEDIGKYIQREIVLGPEAVALVDGKKQRFYQVLDGLAKVDVVVTEANFLLDSQTQLTGEAAGAYGGSLDEQKPKKHQHH